jgi:hypothetical protein
VAAPRRQNTPSSSVDRGNFGPRSRIEAVTSSTGKQHPSRKKELRRTPGAERVTSFYTRLWTACSQDDGVGMRALSELLEHDAIATETDLQQSD